MLEDGLGQRVNVVDGRGEPSVIECAGTCAQRQCLAGPRSRSPGHVPVGLGIVLSAVYFRIDVLLVQAWAGIEAVASYNAVYRVIDALRLFAAAVLAVVLPRLCRAVDLAPLARRIAGAYEARLAETGGETP